MNLKRGLLAVTLFGIVLGFLWTVAQISRWLPDVPQLALGTGLISAILFLGLFLIRDRKVLLPMLLMLGFTIATGYFWTNSTTMGAIYGLIAGILLVIVRFFGRILKVRQRRRRARSVPSNTTTTTQHVDRVDAHVRVDGDGIQQDWTLANQHDNIRAAAAELAEQNARMEENLRLKEGEQEIERDRLRIQKAQAALDYQNSVGGLNEDILRQTGEALAADLVGAFEEPEEEVSMEPIDNSGAMDDSDFGPRT